LLSLGQLKVLRQASQLLADRLRPVDLLKLLTSRGRSGPIFLGCDKAGHSGHKHE
jgi:hypothetical protein